MQEKRNLEFGIFMARFFGDKFRRIHVHVQIAGLNRSLSFTGPSIVKQVISPLEQSPLLKLSTSMTIIRPNGHVVNERSGEYGPTEEEVAPLLDHLPHGFLDQSVLESRTADIIDDIHRTCS